MSLIAQREIALDRYPSQCEADSPCPSCGRRGLPLFYAAGRIPSHSCLLLPTRQAALDHPCGDLALGLCHGCGLVRNVLFDPALMDYSGGYESAQAFSSTFNTFARSLAERWVRRYGLRKRQVMEIGCGDGAFLELLCELGDNRGFGVDPAGSPDRIRGARGSRVAILREFYSSRHAELRPDFICCRHTLEHIPDTSGFLRTIRRSIGDRTDTIVAFEVPDVTRILNEGAFWDIYYEHCNYFGPWSLSRLFGLCGFEVLELSREYDNQYLVIVARPARGESESADSPSESALDQALIARFREACRMQIDRWQRTIGEASAAGRRIAVWGSGSKAVGFLTTLKLRDEVQCIVDINPHKAGRFSPGTGHPIVAPAALAKYRPDYVIVMNPIYVEEIRRDLDRLGLHPDIHAVGTL